MFFSTKIIIEMNQIFNYAKGALAPNYTSVTDTLFDGTVSIAAGANVNSTAADSEGFSSGLVYVDAAAQYDIVFQASDDNTTFFVLDERLNHAAGRNAYQIELKGVKFFRVSVTNDGAAAITPTVRAVLST